MSLTLYHFAPSSPSRSALMTARALNLDIKVTSVNLFAKDQLKEDFVKLNPQHCIPTLQDGEFVLWESRAIATYLVTKYGTNDDLYPKEPCQRALVDRLLYFDMGTLYNRIRPICYPVLFLGETKISQEKKDSLNQAFSWMEEFLNGKKYFAGDKLTVADIALIASVSSIVSVGWKLDQYPKVQTWYNLCSETIPGFQENLEGAKMFGEHVRSKLDAGEI